MGNAVVHFEVSGKDGERLQEFYGSLFDWKIDASNPMGYGVVETGAGEGIAGGIGRSEQDDGHVTFYVRVPACEAGLAGPLCSRLLADLGADVVKVERPGSGDVTRAWDTVARGLSSGFVWMNRGKRSVALDAKEPAGRTALERLAAASDVFLVNFTPGWAEAVGLDEARVRALRPDIVYTEITGYGPDGPYAKRSAYDLVIQGESGLISVTGTAEEPARVGVSVCDLAAGSYAAAATLAALLRRERTGAGERVSVSLFDVSVDWLGYFPHVWWHRDEPPARTGM